ncbi:MAG: glycosyltransferase [Kiritimatiellae bacterium]|nr:glycosyltransferase [Kiritimatiellia bacterium]
MTPRVSVCLPNLNGLPYLEERMRSILAQTLTDWELVVCDSRSDDGSWTFLEYFRSDPRIRLYSVARAGLYAGWNECLRRIRGEFVYIAPADDTCRPTALERLVRALELNPDVDLAVCRYERIDEAGQPLPDLENPDLRLFMGEWYGRPHRRDGKAELIISLCLGCQWNTMPAVLFRRRLLERTGLFRTDCASCADVAWRIKAMVHSDIVYLPEQLASWRWHKKQATAQPLRNRHEQVYRLTLETLREEMEKLPSRWRAADDWLEKLVFWVRHEYFMQFHLNRTALRRTPRAFLAGCVRAALKEPAYLLCRLKTGFSWRVPEYGDVVSYVKDLIRRWEVPWPPTPVATA